VIQATIRLVYDGDVEPIWREVHDRLLEELDYNHEAANIRRMAECHENNPEIIIPGVVDEASSRNVLTMEYVDGIPGDEACSDRYPQERRDQWGVVLVKFVLQGLLEDRLLHADPNFANFAFRGDGRMVVYDFGCVKEIPDHMARAYADLLLAVTHRRDATIPEILKGIGVETTDGDPISRTITDPYAEMFSPIARVEPPYTFGEDDTLYRQLMDHGIDSWTEAANLRFPEDAIFVNRTLGGHFGNLSNLQATGPWRETILEYAESAASGED
jgi:predicted unusual protein kinase regulating ubiquinone biosynthesis (AarF/ABC1/UbiB family)